MAYPQPPGSAVPYTAVAATSSPSDLEGVGHLKIGSILGVVEQAMFWIGFAIFWLIFQALSSATPVYGAAATVPSWVTVSAIEASIGLLILGSVLGIVSYIFFYLGFRAVKRGAQDFGAPTTLVLIGLIGFAMIALGFIVIIGTLISAINNLNTGTLSSGSAAVDLSALLGGVASIGLGSILALIGVIGMVLGNWRAGKRYGESTLKIGSILTIVPFVSIVGYILLLLGYVKAGSKLQSGWVPTSGMMMPGQPVAYGYP
ncbi:MAG: DUF973 family protein, partial [Candidatus Lutacidiplasmatales archaeon]